MKKLILSLALVALATFAKSQEFLGEHISKVVVRLGVPDIQDSDTELGVMYMYDRPNDEKLTVYTKQNSNYVYLECLTYPMWSVRRITDFYSYLSQNTTEIHAGFFLTTDGQTLFNVVKDYQNNVVHIIIEKVVL